MFGCVLFQVLLPGRTGDTMAVAPTTCACPEILSGDRERQQAFSPPATCTALCTKYLIQTTSLHDNDVPCAVCHVNGRPTKLMIPAKRTCPDGWTKEYWGYLMAEQYNHAGRTTYVCMDNAPEVIEGGRQDRNGVLFYNTEAECGGPLPNYVDGWEITCVVCTQ